MVANLKDEETYWREHHSEQAFGKEHPFSDFAAAYRTGYEGFHKYPGKKYEEVEDDLALDYQRSHPGAALPWDHARHATHAAWAKLSNDVAPRDPDRGMRGSI